MIVPEQLPIDASFASSFSVEGEATARDLSYALMFLREASDIDQAGEVMLHDNATRHALALSRRDRIEVEDARWSRLRDCRINGLPAPTIKMTHRPDGTPYPWRHKSGDLRLMMIDEGLLEAYRGDGDDIVHFPLRLLQQAESRYSIILMMRVLGWSLGDFDRKALVRQNDRSVTLRFSIADWIDIAGTTDRTWNKRLAEAILIPAAAEITKYTDWQITIRPRVAHTGRIRDIDIVIVDPVDDPADNDNVIEAKSRSWRPATRPSKKGVKEAALAPATPVTVSKAAVDRAVPLSVVR